ncbi:MAG TPA: class I SAM-dependent methyltransferase [Solirubrobacterales bacterium]|nr:class I SAM-dependent methyltransferase [Solirubrobacterales bacterium]
MATEAPADWYRTSFAPNFHSLYFEQGGEEKVELALAMLKPSGHERILDLACATGRRTLELSRRGFGVLGVDIRQELLEVAACEAQLLDLWPRFLEEDPRYLDFEHEFDLVLSLGGGSFEHFDYDGENLRAFEAAARALRSEGRLLMQVPNVLHVEAHLPERTWLTGSEAVDLVEQHWNEPTHRLDGTRKSMLECEDPEDAEPVPFQRRLYSVEELAEIFEAVGLHLANVFDENGAPCAPTDAQQEIYVEARV